MDNSPINVSAYNKTPYVKSKYMLIMNKTVFVWLYHVTRIILSGIFLWSGISKLYNPVSFAIIIDAYGLVPDTLILPIAIVLSLAEVIAALGLLFDIRGSLTFISILLILFLAVLSYGIWLGLDLDCGCFGLNDPEANAIHSLSKSLFRDVFMVAGVLYLYVYRYCQSLKLISFVDVFNKFKIGDSTNEEMV